MACSPLEIERLRQARLAAAAQPADKRPAPGGQVLRVSVKASIAASDTSGTASPAPKP
jgi:hypothetical protein